MKDFPSIFPLEFIVQGTPVHFQSGSRSRPAVTLWKERVRNAARATLPAGHVPTGLKLAVTLYYFPAAEMQGDIDNIVKYILDAMNECVYDDDKQVQRVVVQKFEPGSVFQFRAPSSILAQAIDGSKPLLYVRISDEPFEDVQ